MKKIIDGRLIDTEKMPIEELIELKEKLKVEENNLFIRINNFLKETKD